MNRSWFRSFFLSFVLTILFIIIYPEKNVSIYWFSFNSAYWGALLFLFCSLFILIRNLRYLFSYLIEIPSSGKEHYGFRFRFWMIIFLGWFMVNIFLFPDYLSLFSLFLIIREVFIWRKKKKRTLTFK